MTLEKMHFLYFHFTFGCLSEVWLKWFYRRRFLNAIHVWVFSCYFATIISLWKRAWLFILTNLNFLHPWMLCTKFGCMKLVLLFWWCEKFPDRQTNGRRSENLTWAFSSGELQKKSFKKMPCFRHLDLIIIG